ncbi:MAG: glycosyltransferase family 1 protein [Microbacteriaceae bacterium]|nr:glycosyltransferase family 1 protein [Microbacteriaceae bacterium]MCL2794268.1 glycosyltransferase family 1 protein [Microbacteriaceae bacterium]
MRIAFVTETWKPSVNGVVTRIASTVDELVAAGHEVLVIAPSLGAADAAVERQRGVTLRRVPSFRVKWVYGGQPWGWPLPRVRRMLADFRPDLVHVVSPFTLGIAGVRAARRLRLPLVTSFHTDIAAYAGSYHLAWSRPIIWRMLRALHNAGRLNLVTSRHSATLLAAHGIPDSLLWRRGVDVERFGAVARDRPAKAVPTALYVGRLAHEKNISSLVPLARSGRVHLKLVGDGPDRLRLEDEFAGTGTEFAGTLTGQALVDAYAAADVFVFTSTTETLGLVLIEALASGLPIAAVESPASRELLGPLDGIARLVRADRPGDFVAAVDGLLAGGTPAELGHRARAEAAGWSWATATEELLGYYARTLAPQAAPAAGAPASLLPQ